MPDMRLPIGYALAYPDRLSTAFGPIDWTRLSSLEFEPPDRSRFPCLDIAYRAGRAADLAPAWLNAANEVAVGAFLAGRISWNAIAEVVEGTLDHYGVPSTPASIDDPGLPARSVDDVLDADAGARRVAEVVVAGRERAA
jgi:1-deoxy-D-xylulose-5-phosphate reductoisomerase